MQIGGACYVLKTRLVLVFYALIIIVCLFG
jgi:hypothetical protein